MKEEIITIIRSADNDGLLPFLEPGVAPTRLELLELARFWMKRAIDIKFSAFLYREGIKSSDWRTMDFGYQRISRIGDLLGKEALDKIKEEVFEELSKDYGREWEVFLHGDKAETRAVQDEVHRHFSGEGCHNSRCTQNDGVQVCQPDWSWIEQETQKHRQGLCSLGEYEDSSTCREPSNT